jgi:glycosyltransferase involved in cell wall biosynthesis
LDGTPLTVSPGGVARYTLALAVALAEQHPEDRYSLISDQPLPSIDGAPANLETRTFTSRRWWSAGLPRQLVQANFDVFHGTDFAVPYLPVRSAVMTIHDLSPWLEPAWQPSATRIRRRTPTLLKTGLAKMVITPSETIRRAAIDRFWLPAWRVVAIPLAASSVFRPIDAQPPTIPYFLYVGTLEPRKNLFRLINAWREVRRHTRVDLVLAGRVRDDFTPPHPEQGLLVAGAVTDEELVLRYSRAAAVVYPSLYEGFGLPVLEAMQCGALVITSRDPAILETTGGDAAVHVDANDERALAQALAAAFGDTSQIRERALARARRFSWQATATKTREVYAAVSR